MGGEVQVLIARPRSVAVAPQQDLVREIAELGAGLRVDEIPGAGDREVELEFLTRGMRNDRVRFGARLLPRCGEVQVEVAKAQRALDRVGRRGPAGATDADCLAAGSAA